MMQKFILDIPLLYTFKSIAGAVLVLKTHFLTNTIWCRNQKDTDTIRAFDLHLKTTGM